MPKKSHFVTVRDQRDSVWQSVVEKVAKREAKKAVARASPVGSNPG